MLLMREETFGPVLPILVVDTLEEMLRQANDSSFGLSATVWTRDTARGKQIARQLRAGSVWVNTGLASYGNPLTPRGGFKQSGIGKIGGRLGLLEMVDAKLIDIADQSHPKAWWYPLWPNAYAFFKAGLTLMHDQSPAKRLQAALEYLRTRR
ncbi:MAG TPA: aldehyde dehydrogenase family protein, partial [Oscillatoriaceae cyanobacterium]